jgi:hypothetical protein
MVPIHIHIVSGNKPFGVQQYWSIYSQHLKTGKVWLSKGWFRAKPKSDIRRPFDNWTNYPVINGPKLNYFKCEKLWHFIFKKWPSLVDHSITRQIVRISDHGLKTGHNYRTGLLIKISKNKMAAKIICLNHLKTGLFFRFHKVVTAI